MSELHDAALGYAHRGWGVVPLHGIVNGTCACGRDHCSSPGKHPLVRRGLYEATTSSKEIQGWWRRWRSANIGIATGAESGIVVIDVDLPQGEPSLERLARLDRKLPSTLTVRTGGGGRHLYFSYPDRSLPNTAGRLPNLEEALAGIDVRAEGGYVVAPPSLHHSGEKYSWVDATLSPSELPDWIREPERAPPSAGAASPSGHDGNGSPYGLHVLTAELSQLQGATPGTRNHALNRAAFAVSQVVAGGELDEHHARAELLTAALAIGLPEPESRQTLDSAFDAGLRQPRVAPHRLR